MANEKRLIDVLRSAVFFGGIWGFLEATLGYLLHLIPIVLPAPSLSGALLFPVGFALMYGAFVSSGSISAVPLTAIVAAAVKTASLALPFVSFPFVRNPVLAILAEGLVSFAALGLFCFRSKAWFVPLGLGMSLAWRGIFLLVNLILGIRGGIIDKGTAGILQFLLVDSAANTVLIALALLAASTDRVKSFTRAAARVSPAGVALVGAAAVGAEILFRLL
jgi:hypothetical protein